MSRLLGFAHRVRPARVTPDALQPVSAWSTHARDSYSTPSSPAAGTCPTYKASHAVGPRQRQVRDAVVMMAGHGDWGDEVALRGSRGPTSGATSSLQAGHLHPRSPGQPHARSCRGRASRPIAMQELERLRQAAAVAPPPTRVPLTAGSDQGVTPASPPAAPHR